MGGGERHEDVLQARSQRRKLQDPAAVGPTSLALAGASVDRGELLISLLSAFSHWYGRWHAAAGDPAACGLMTAYRSACLTVGRDVTVRLPRGASIPGRAASRACSSMLQ